MLPYFTLVSFQLGPLTIYVWGLCVAVGFLAGIISAYFVCKKPPHSPPISPKAKQGELEGVHSPPISPKAKQGELEGVDFNKIFNLSILLLIAGIFGGRLFWWLEHLGEVGSFWEFVNISDGGLSSLGGFVFVGIVLTIGLREPRGLPKPLNKWQYADVLAISFIPLWFFSRLGCFLIHEHPGRLSNFFLAVNFPGGARHDLALYEIILMIFIGVSFLILKIWSSARERAQIPLNPPLKKGEAEGDFIPPLIKGEAEGDFKNQNNKPRDGFHALSLILTYSFSRFFLDFLRATDLPNSDPRYFGLMLSQYGMAVLFVVAIILTKMRFYGKKNKQEI